MNEQDGGIFRKSDPEDASHPCPLCLSVEPKTEVRGADHRRYHLCSRCRLIFADPSHRFSREDETAHYRTHENSIENAGYVAFLNRILTPMLPYLDQSMRGLDYGCGPGPTLSELVRRRGIACEDYDPLFFDRPLHPPYDFIFSTECFEHFHSPHEEIGSVIKLLKPGGFLGIMTEQWTTVEQFETWYYTKDPTHVSFYHHDTLAYLCERFDLEIVLQEGTRVVVFRRRREHGAPED